MESWETTNNYLFEIWETWILFSLRELTFWKGHWDLNVGCSKDEYDFLLFSCCIFFLFINTNFLYRVSVTNYKFHLHEVGKQCIQVAACGFFTTLLSSICFIFKFYAKVLERNSIKFNSKFCPETISYSISNAQRKCPNQKSTCPINKT